ncbi:MAG: V-type ATP synthase subunit I [Actinobacteria bacterium]|nr:V-type ATP synthase subunit I [Actinomycetota bacterium]
MGLKPTIKFSVICHQQDAGRLLDYLSTERVLHPELQIQQEQGLLIREETELRQRLAKVEYCLSKIEPFIQKEGIRSAIEENRPSLSYDKFIELALNLDVSNIFEEISSLSEKIEEIEEDIDFLENEYNRFIHFRNIKLSKSSFINEKRRHFRVLLAQAKKSDYDRFIETLPELSVAYKVIQEDKRKENSVLFVLIYHIEQDESVRRGLAENRVEIVNLPTEMKEDESFSEYLDRIQLRKIELNQELIKLKEKLSAYVSRRSELMAAYDYYFAELEKFEKSQLFLKTSRCVLIEGWVPQERARKLKEEVERLFICEATISEEERVGKPKPVILENKGILKSVQLLTELYGYPSSNEPDPTPLIAPYFLLFFGMCIGDAGYGALLLLLGIILKLRFKLKETVKSFADFFILGGVGAIIFGILSASYFSVDAKYLPEFLLRFKIFDPIENPVGILALSLVFGLIHLITGILVGAYLSFKNDKKSLVFLGEIGKAMIVLGASAYLSTLFIRKNNLITNFASYTLVVGAFLIVFFSSPGQRGLLRRILSGLYNLYGMSSYLGDVSSYARLMALMLAGVLIGMAVNILTGLSIQILGVYAGFPIAIIIGIVGHLFNLVMSIVSGFIHSLRLQFVEYFKQFYSDGGVKFNPLGVKERYIRISEKG